MQSENDETVNELVVSSPCFGDIDVCRAKNINAVVCARVSVCDIIGANIIHEERDNRETFFVYALRKA